MLQGLNILSIQALAACLIGARKHPDERVVNRGAGRKDGKTKTSIESPIHEYLVAVYFFVYDRSLSWYYKVRDKADIFSSKSILDAIATSKAAMVKWPCITDLSASTMEWRVAHKVTRAAVSHKSRLETVCTSDFW